MRTTALNSIALMIALVAGAAAADTAQLKINGDLMVHPDQISSFFTIATDKIKASTTWDWPELHFAKPYKTAWTGVRAQGPFDIQFTTDGLKNQEVGFEFNWDNPALSVGQFQIDDTITRNVGGANIIIHLAGQCSGMTMTIPNGQWKVKGRLAWEWTANGVEVKWTDFSFSMNGQAPAQADFGQCQGPSGLQAALQQAFDAIEHDPSWLQDVLKDGVLDWVQNSLGSLQTELMKARTISLKPGLDLTWQPEGVSGLNGGLVRVAGNLVLMRDDQPVSDTLLDRSYDDSALAAVSESGFVLPKDTLPTLVAFIYKTGDLQYRVTSDKIDSFSSLMQSRFLQFFVWPDLMQFAKNTIFYFDIMTSKAPQLSGGVMRQGGGIRYNVSAPVLVHQWAPSTTQYVPYVDFTSALSGRLEAYVKGGTMTLQMSPNAMSVAALFRPEYSKLRSVTAWLATSLLDSRVQGYLQSTPVTFAIPQWELGTGLDLSIRDVQAWQQSFRVPLQFTRTP